MPYFRAGERFTALCKEVFKGSSKGLQEVFNENLGVFKGSFPQ
jgi:hypothetical protein